jgi:hypothetical protein
MFKSKPNSFPFYSYQTFLLLHFISASMHHHWFIIFIFL